MKIPAFEKFIPESRRSLSAWGIGLTAVAFVCVNVISGNVLKNARVDLTEDQSFTISQGTKDVLTGIGEPIDLRFYYSSTLEEAAPSLSPYVRRVSELLSEYERRADGKLRVTRLDPQPFSQEEDKAVSDGLSGIPLRADNSTAYFGLAATNSTDDEQVIPYLSPERSRFLEYDLTRMIHDLANPEKPVVGLIGDVPWYGSQMNRFQPMAVVSKIEESFQIKQLTGDFNKIDEEVDVLLIAQPKGLSEEKQYAIDQFAMNGGRILAFVDPFAETLGQPGPMGGQLPGESIAAMEPLLNAWGVSVSKDKFVADAENAVRVQAPVQGRPMVVDYLAWMGFGQSHINRDDLVTSELKRLNFNSPGFIQAVAGAETTIESLISTSQSTQEIDVAKIQFQPDPAGLLSEFEPSGTTYDLAVRISGKAKSAFSGNLPEAIAEDAALKQAHKDQSSSNLNIMLVADADLLSDRNWIEEQALFGNRFEVPIANNGDLVINALENLSGTEGLIALRGKGVTNRPFTVIASMEREAEQKFRAKEQELLTQIEETSKKIADLKNEERERGVLLASTQQKEIEDFQVAMLDMRQELRGVQRSLREDVDGLKSWLTMLNIWGVPALIALLALGLTFSKRLRNSRSQAA